MTRRNDIVILLMILLGATVARVVHLDGSLWFDEIITLVKAIRAPFGELISGATYHFNNHVLYSLQAKLSVLVFGEHNWSVRLPAMVFGVAGIAVMWSLARLASGALQAHATALLIAFSYHHVWYSQSARGYTEIMFWCVLSTIILLRNRDQRTWAGWIAFGLVNALAAYTHLTALFFVAAQAIFIALVVFRDEFLGTGAVNRDAWLQPLVAFLITGVLTLLVYAPHMMTVLDSVAELPETSKGAISAYTSPIWTVQHILDSFGVNTPLMWLITLSAICMTGIGMVSMFRKEPAVPIIFVLHITIMLLTLLALSMRIWPRFFFIDMGFVLLFMVDGVFVCSQFIAKMAARVAPRKLSGNGLFVLAACVMLAVSVDLLKRNYQYPKQDWDGLAAYLGESMQSQDRLVGLASASVPLESYFLLDAVKIKSLGALIANQSDKGATWVVVMFPGLMDRRYPEVIQELEEHYTLARKFKGTLGDGAILVYRKGHE